MDANPKKELNNDEELRAYASSAYDSAEEFFRVSIILLPYVVMYTIPIMSNVSFSCELYLKSILSYTGRATTSKQLKGHNLFELFNKIDDEEIEQRIITNSGEKNFQLTLKEVGKAFEVSRYVHEYREMTCDVDFLYKFMYALHNECQTLIKGAKS